MARLNNILQRRLAEKIAAVRPSYRHHCNFDCEDLRGTTLLNMMLASTAYRKAVLEQFIQMTEVHFCNDGEEARFYAPIEQVTDQNTYRGPFTVTKWFAAYLFLHNCLAIQTLLLDATTTDSIRRRRGAVIALGEDSTTLSVLFQLLDIDVEGMGIQGHQVADLNLDRASVATYSDNLSDLDLFLALRPQEFRLEVVLGACPKKLLEGRNRVHMPEPTMIRVDAQPPSFPDLSLARDWTQLLAYLLDACPNLCSLDLRFPLEETSWPSAMGSFPREVFPQLPQHTGAQVVVRYELGLFHRQIVDQRIAQNEEIVRTFDEETTLLEGEVVHRSRRWERGRGNEPWWITLRVRNKGEMFPMTIPDGPIYQVYHHHESDEEEEEEVGDYYGERPYL